MLISEPFLFATVPSIMRIASSLLLATLLCACGYKGPLYLPESKPQAQPAKPAPAPQQERGKAGTQEPPPAQ
jgi:predicted small lipoprotein YifL